jgi:hypothetical protein
VAKDIMEFSADTPVSSMVGRSITSLRYFRRKSRVIACRREELSMGITSTCRARLGGERREKRGEGGMRERD